MVASVALLHWVGTSLFRRAMMDCVSGSSAYADVYVSVVGIGHGLYAIQWSTISRLDSEFMEHEKAVECSKMRRASAAAMQNGSPACIRSTAAERRR